MTTVDEIRARWTPLVDRLKRAVTVNSPEYVCAVVDLDAALDAAEARTDTYRRRAIALREQAQGIRYEMRIKLEAAELNCARAEARVAELERCFLAGKFCGEEDEGNLATPCPHPEESIERHWWTRGYAYAARLQRAFDAEMRVKELERENDELRAFVKLNAQVLEAAKGGEE